MNCEDTIPSNPLLTQGLYFFNDPKKPNNQPSIPGTIERGKY